MPTFRHLARWVFTTFLLTFIASRVLVILIMARKVPDLFLHMGGTHVHHLNYGIFILSALGAVLLFVPLNARQRLGCAVAYGFGMALTFDEFGMWLHLGGGYWQRASFDAIIVILGLFGMLAFAPGWQKMRAHHWITGAGTIIVVVLFYLLLFRSLNYVDRKDGTRLQQLDQNGPQ
ncbi:MAG: hypothetical protein LV481_00095 [Methylacidiphilales bacterium]|nr:hypothetical protein [Candidatus Methylacidiphilales bacterium]